MIILVEQQIEFSELTTLNFGLEKLTTILWFTRILPWCRRLLSCRAHIHWTALNRLGASPSFKSQSTTSLPTKQHWYIRKWYLRSLIMSGFLSQCSRALRCSDNSKIWTNLEEIRSILLLLYSYHISLSLCWYLGLMWDTTDKSRAPYEYCPMCARALIGFSLRRNWNIIMM